MHHPGDDRIQELSRGRILIAGIKVMHMIRTGQLGAIKGQASSPANQSYSLTL